MGQLIVYRMLKTMDNYKTITPKSVAFAYQRWSFMKGSNYREILVFGINGHLREVRGGGTWRFDSINILCLPSAVFIALMLVGPSKCLKQII